MGYPALQDVGDGSRDILDAHLDMDPRTLRQPLLKWVYPVIAKARPCPQGLEGCDLFATHNTVPVPTV